MDKVMVESNDQQGLVHQARRGDRPAFDKLAAGARSRLLGQINGMVGQKLREKVDPEDILQEVFLRGLESIERFEGNDGASFLRWLEGIA